MEHLLRLKVTTVCHLPQKLTFWFVGKLKGVSFWRKKKAWASNFEASSNLTFEKTSYSDKEIKRELALAFRTEFSPCIAGSGRSIFGSSPESQNDKWAETVETYMSNDICNTVAAMSVQCSSHFDLHSRFQLSFYFAEYWSLQLEFFLNSDQE